MSLYVGRVGNKNPTFGRAVRTFVDVYGGPVRGRETWVDTLD